jgi:hypothetical protein
MAGAVLAGSSLAKEAGRRLIGVGYAKCPLREVP